MEGEGLEESKALEPDFDGIEENRKVDYDIVLPLNDPNANDILYSHPAPDGFFAFVAMLLRDVFYFICFGSGYTKFSNNDDGDVDRLKRRLQLGMTDTADSREDNAIHSRFWVKHGIDVYTRQDDNACQASRLQVPPRMVFTNEKLIGPPPPAQENGGTVYQRPGRQSISFHKPDGTPLSNTNVEEPIRHTLILQRNKMNKSVQPPIPINEIQCRYDELLVNDDDDETGVDNAIKYEDVVKESRSMGLFGWPKPTNVPTAFDVDVNMRIDEEGRGQKDLSEEEYEKNKRERDLWFE